MTKILIVEDNKTISKNLSRYLGLKNIESEICESAEDAELLLNQNNNFDIILLDIGLPGINGDELLIKLRKNGNNTPVIFLTSRDTDEDIISGLELGADDYISKPFDYEILIARINSVLRRYKKRTNSEIIGEYIINFDKEEITNKENNSKIFLSNLEFKLLAFLVKNRGKVLDRATIYEEVWGNFDDFQLSRNTDIYVGYLRKKLGADIIKTKKGSGYYVD
ncbi:MAG: response regulator transcription factor [Candidatus Gracilibacteria bacterium]|nr:response regulator transcription factor [Candidatus Gracilibacteria bacterium]MDQ7023026.1 response regulator transcription factor [Candidatus Gracilibacteria bacterium]